MGGVDTMDLMMTPVMHPRQPLLTDVTVWRGTVSDHGLDAIAGVLTTRDGWWMTRDFLEQAPSHSLWAPFRPWVLSPGAADLSPFTAYAVELSSGEWMPKSLFLGIAELRSADQYTLNGWDLLMLGESGLPTDGHELVTLPPYTDWARFFRAALGGFAALARHQLRHPVVEDWRGTKGTQWARRLHLPDDDPAQFLDWLDRMLPVGSRPDRWPLPPRRALAASTPVSHRLVDWLATSGRHDLLERARVVEGLWDMCMLIFTVNQTVSRPHDPTSVQTVRQALTLLVALHRLYREAAFAAQALVFVQPRSGEEC